MFFAEIIAIAVVGGGYTGYGATIGPLDKSQCEAGIDTMAKSVMTAVNQIPAEVHSLLVKKCVEAPDMNHLVGPGAPDASLNACRFVSDVPVFGNVIMRTYSCHSGYPFAAASRSPLHSS